MSSPIYNQIVFTYRITTFLSAVSAGLFGRFIGREVDQKYVTTGSIMVTCALSYCAFYEVALLGQPCHFDLMTWIDSEMS